ncbi:hypothetical protein [Defluviimonas sp. SAOS-178_SWC]|uniref:hypothetical protein n=1 Tax=Defluviimonas sp. SAOS-178_SWC TaxID=3121287 RepID=UPI0032221D2F
MTMKSLAVSGPDYVSSVVSVPSYLRIAVPSWRSVGNQQLPEPVVEQPTVSREELQSLFQGELNVRSKKKSKLTAREEQEKTLAKRIRRALYPYQGNALSH